jgi:hypothetical protein
VSPDRDIPALSEVFRVGHAETVTSVAPDPELGMVSRAAAVARNVELLGGAVRIGEARTEAVAIAHGRAGTAGTQLVRTFSEVSIGPPGEEPAYACGFGDDSCDPEQIVRAINELYPSHVEAYIPEPDRSLADPGAATDNGNGSPGGARARVQRTLEDQLDDEVAAGHVQSELPALVVVVYGDPDEPFRAVLQFAAVSVDAAYAITALESVDVDPSPSPAPEPTPIERATDPNASAAPSPAPTSLEQDGGPVSGGVGNPTVGTPVQAPSLPLPTAAGPDGDGPVAPPVTAAPAPLLEVGQRVVRQLLAEGGPLAVLAALALLPAYLSARRRALGTPRMAE